MVSLGSSTKVSDLASNSASLTTEEWMIAQMLNPKLVSSAQGQQNNIDEQAANTFVRNLISGKQTMPGSADAPARWGTTGTNEGAATSGAGPSGGFIGALVPILSSLAGPLINSAIGAFSSLFSKKGSGTRAPNMRGGRSRAPNVQGKGILNASIQDAIIQKLESIPSANINELNDTHKLWKTVIDIAESVIADHIKQNNSNVSGGAPFLARQALAKTLPHGFIKFINDPKLQRHYMNPRPIDVQYGPTIGRMAIPLMRYGARKILGNNDSRINNDMYEREAHFADSSIAGAGKFTDTIKRLFPKVLKIAKSGLSRILSDPSIRAAAAEATPKIINGAFSKFGVDPSSKTGSFASNLLQQAANAGISKLAQSGSGTRNASMNMRGEGSRAPNGSGSSNAITLEPGTSYTTRTGANRGPLSGGAKKKSPKVNFRVKVL